MMLVRCFTNNRHLSIFFWWMYANYIQSRFIVLGDNDADHSMWLKKKKCCTLAFLTKMASSTQLWYLSDRTARYDFNEIAYLTKVFILYRQIGDVTHHSATTQRHVKCHALSSIAPIREQMPSFSIKLSHGAIRGSYSGIVVVQQVPKYSYIIPFLCV